MEDVNKSENVDALLSTEPSSLIAMDKEGESSVQIQCAPSSSPEKQINNTSVKPISDEISAIVGNVSVNPPEQLEAEIIKTENLHSKIEKKLNEDGQISATQNKEILLETENNETALQDDSTNVEKALNKPKAKDETGVEQSSEETKAEIEYQLPTNSADKSDEFPAVEVQTASAKEVRSIVEKVDENHIRSANAESSEISSKGRYDDDGDKSDDVESVENSVMVIEIDDDEDEAVTVASSLESPHRLKETLSASSVSVPTGTEEDQSENTTSKQPPESKDPNELETLNDKDPCSKEDVAMKEQTLVETQENLSLKAQEENQNSVVDDATKLLEEMTTTPKSQEDLIPTDDDDTSANVYYNKECINYECPRQHKQFFRAPLLALSYFKIAKKKYKPQFICSTCYDAALDMYEDFCGLLAAKQPLLLKDVVSGRQEFVEIIDSSDEEHDEEKAGKSKDNNCFSKDDIKLIEQELDNSIKKVLDKVEIQNQLTWSKTILTSRLKALQAETMYIDEELRSLQKKADNMHVSLYQSAKIKVRQLQPLDLNTGRPYTTIDPELTLPPIGEVHRPPIQINETYYAVKNKAIASWVPCKVMEQAESTIVAQKNIKNYKIKFLKSHYQMVKTVSVKHLAYFNPPSVRLPIGSRVIAYFDATSLSRGKEKMMITSAFYPGIIAEPLKPNNKYRYLIFYDDGYTQYVYHKDVRLVCHVSENVWEDVYPGSRDFIQKYLTQYSINRPMVQTQKGQSMTTESYGKWIYARVVDIDCSLIQMQFEGPKSHTEWIYRGSMRLGPVFKEHQKSMQKSQMPISRLPRRTEPFIRYTEDEEAASTQQEQRDLQLQQQQQQQQQLQQQPNEPRAVAKKSVSRQESLNTSSQPAPVVRHLNNSTIYVEDENKPKGKVVYYTAKRNLPPLVYSVHDCSPKCLFKISHNLAAYSPLSKPLLSGWERIILRQKVKKVVTYRGPCGKIVRNMKELRHYLRVTENVLNVDNFDFNHETNCLAEYVIDSAIVQVRDISGGQEKMAIPLVNYYDNTMPPECKYAAQRIPTEGVNLNLDEEFLVGCDCDGDCSDKETCSCWQLTYSGAKYGNPNTPMEEIGYQYKRLYEHVPTGIYECNSRCKCKSNCLNRVVQHSLEMKLQVFKTSNRGWGLRCINDIPRGSFICVYAGHLLTEDRANEGGLDVGDEYFAELDYIEVAEQIKEGYESDVESAEPEEDEEFLEQEDDDEFTPSKPLSTRSKLRPQRATRGNQQQSTEEDSQERQMINFNPNAVMDENSMRESSIRQLYGKDEACYVMDAKIIGNLGRYFNHSCSPNLFVQNVFVDTHDLRFPWVAFFASTHIRAGTELTWNYNYEVGVVPGKVLYCQCGAPNCRLRLL